MSADSQTTATLTLPLVWRERASGDATLYLGDNLEIGEVMFMPRVGVWCSLGGVITHHRSTGHADKVAAMTALVCAVKELEHAN